MKLYTMTKVALTAAALALGTLGATAQIFVTPSGSEGSGGSAVAASATFSEVTIGGTSYLQVIVVNTFGGSPGYQYNVANTLYGITFGGVAANDLTLASAYVPNGQTEWTLETASKPYTYSSESVNVSGHPGMTIPWVQEGDGVTGAGNGKNAKEGLVGDEFDGNNAGGGLTEKNGHNPVFDDEAIFDFTYSGAINPASIDDVVFQYGTQADACAENIQGVPYTPVPEASTVMAGALMLLPLGMGMVRALRRERPTHL